MDLDARKDRILQALVQDYIETAEPVGSEWLVSHHDLGCKPATVRNAMAEMSDLGYLRQPHTSAGRIPSDRGYRYYVDRLMPETPLPKMQARRAVSAFAQRSETEIETVLLQTCRMLSEITQYPSMAAAPAAEALTLRRIYLTGALSRQALMVALLSTGHVEHRLLELDFTPEEGALTRVGNYLNDALAGLALTEIAEGAALDCPPELTAHHALLSRAAAALLTVVQSLAQSRLFIEGTGHILREPEFHDVARLQGIFDALEHHNLLYHILRRALMERDVTVIIGGESAAPALHEYSFVGTHYRIGDRAGGFLGVVGPTRMRYDRAIAAVRLMARNLSELLTRLSGC